MALDRNEIVDAALALLNEVGIDKLSTRALATRLGVAQPALYWHFRNKEELLDALNAEMIARHHERAVPLPGESWDDFAVAMARSMRAALLAVRDGARLNAGTRPTPAQFADAEAQLALYVSAGFTPTEALGISLSIARFVEGFVLEEQGERQRDDGPAIGDGDSLMDEVAPFPVLSAALGSILTAGTINTESAFEAGLGYMIAGIRASLAAKNKNGARGRRS